VVDGHRAGEADDRVLRRGVGAAVEDAAQSRGRGGVDDDALLLRQEDLREASLERRKVPFDVDAEDVVELLLVVVTALPATPMPALLQRMSRPPSSLTVPGDHPLAVLGLARRRPRAGGLALGLLDERDGLVGGLGGDVGDGDPAPSRAKARAAAWPMPDPAPVMRTTLFLNRGCMADDLPRVDGERQGIGAADCYLGITGTEVTCPASLNPTAGVQETPEGSRTTIRTPRDLFLGSGSPRLSPNR
jgi:hypothetical protein